MAKKTKNALKQELTDLMSNYGFYIDKIKNSPSLVASAKRVAEYTTIEDGNIKIHHRCRVCGHTESVIKTDSFSGRWVCPICKNDWVQTDKWKHCHSHQELFIEKLADGFFAIEYSYDINYYPKNGQLWYDFDPEVNVEIYECWLYDRNVGIIGASFHENNLEFYENTRTKSYQRDLNDLLKMSSDDIGISNEEWETLATDCSARLKAAGSYRNAITQGL
jgi:predicted Zn-ribbon and HTH transcriptional regulator